jgi:two-component system, OmpR family, response regulator
MSTINYATILIVDDDQQICDLLNDFLTKHGYRVFIAHEERAMLKLLKEKKIDLLVLDIMLPGSDGLTLCRKAREQSNIPIIFLSALSEDADRIIGLETGADDYLTKPFNPHELLARVKALLRRASFSKEAKKNPEPVKIKFADWILDQKQRCLITKDRLKVPLSSGEFDMLMVFIENAGQVLNRDKFLDLMKGKEYSGFDRAIDVQVGRLRKKLNDDPKDPQIIITVRNAGYQLVPKVEYI